MEREREQRAAYWAPFVTVATACGVGLFVALAAYVERKVAPVGEYVAQVYGAKAPVAAAKQEAAKLAAARQVK